jgi:hypothetical protein
VFLSPRLGADSILEIRAATRRSIRCRAPELEQARAAEGSWKLFLLKASPPVLVFRRFCTAASLSLYLAARRAPFVYAHTGADRNITAGTGEVEDHEPIGGGSDGQMGPVGRDSGPAYYASAWRSSFSSEDGRRPPRHCGNGYVVRVARTSVRTMKELTGTDPIFRPKCDLPRDD